MAKVARHSILLVSPCFPPAHGGGGLRIERTYRRLAEMLPLDVTVITEASRYYTPGWSSHAGWPVYALPPDLSTVSFARQLAGVAVSGLRRFSAIHLVGLDVLTKRVGLLGYLARVPLIAELTVETDLYRPSLRGTVALLPFRRAALAIALTERIGAWMRQMSVPEERIWQRPNPVDITLFRMPNANQRMAARQALGLTAGKIVHLVFGRFCPRKNQLLAVEALAHLPAEHHLLLAGPAFAEDASYIEDVHRTIARHGLDGRVILLPRHIDDAAALYFAADQLWLPSQREGLPNVMLEAQCCGVPVVVNTALSLNDYLENGRNGTLADATAAEFAAAAQGLLPLSDDTGARQALSRRACERYDAQAHCRTLANHLAPILGLHTPAMNQKQWNVA